MIYVISKWFDNFPEKKTYFEQNAPPELFPVVDFEKKTIKANRLHSQILKYGDTFEEKINLIRKYIGALNSDTPPKFTLKPTNVTIKLKITPSMETSPYMHGWYSSDTRKALEGAIQYYKPRVVFELGVWYGQSSVGIFQSAQNKIEYYGFDYFTPTATNPDYVTMSHADKMFIPHPRLESAVSNLAPFSKKHDIYFVFDDVMKSPEFGVTPDLVFIDAIKKEQELVKIIRQFQKLNPDVIIVCDDYIFPSVRQALKSFRKKEFGDYCCILGDVPELPEPVSDFSKYPALKLTSEQKEELPSKLKTYFGGGTFFQELDSVFQKETPKRFLTLKHAKLPEIKFRYGLRTENDTVIKQMKSDGIYDVLTFQYASSAKNMSPKLENVLERIKSSALKEFLRIFITNSNTLRNMLIDKIIQKTEKQPTSRMIFIPKSFDPKHYGQSVDAHDILFYGKTVETKFTLFDVYDKVLNNKKVLDFLNTPMQRCSEVTLNHVGIYPPEKNLQCKNILIQILQLNKCLELGGSLSTQYSSRNIKDVCILLSNCFKHVKVFSFAHRIGQLYFNIYAEHFLGISESVYSTVYKHIFKHETNDIVSLFGHTAEFDAVEKQYALDKAYIETLYINERSTLLKQIDKIKEQQIDRTIQDIYKYILLEENENETELD
jgi:predicted O-methyltransferase YrrM